MAEGSIETVEESKAKRGRVGTDNASEERYAGRGGVFESLDGGGGQGPAKCASQLSLRKTDGEISIPHAVEGWIVFVRGLSSESLEEDVMDAFQEFGDVKNVQLNLDRRTGFAKGYALVEFENKSEAEAAIKEMDGKDLLGARLSVDWAILAGPKRRR